MHATAHMGEDHVGLVRTLDPEARRHRYGAGVLPAGKLARELGVLATQASPDRIPVWVEDAGVVTSDYRPRRRPPGPLQLARWVLAPLRWAGFDSAPSRALIALERAAEAQAIWKGPRGALPQPSGEPSGYLERHLQENRWPLYSAVHPVTGDQIVATDQREVSELGYVDAALLGYLHTRSPAGRGRATGGFRIPWASRQGMPQPISELELPSGKIDEPREGSLRRRQTLAVRGWAMLPSGPPVRVDVVINGQRVARARLGIPRADVPAYTTHEGAAVSGFEHVETGLDPSQGTLRVGAVAHGAAGERYALEEVEITLGPPRLGEPDLDRPAPFQPPPRVRSERARLLVYTHDLGLGGAQLYLVETLERVLAAEAFACTVVSPSDGPLRQRLESNGIDVHLSPSPPANDAALYEGRLAEFLAWAESRRFDLALVNSMLAFPGADAAERLGIPYVFAVHESEPLPSYWDALRAADPVRRRGEHALAAASAVLFEAEATRRAYLPYAGSERLITLPYGIEIDEIDRFRASFDMQAARRRHGIPDDARVVLCLGTLEPRKLQTPLVQAFGSIAGRHPDALLAIVGDRKGGRTTAYAWGLRQYALETRLWSRVRIAPLTGRPYEWHGIADVLVCPSDIESLPRAVLEAMAFETPVLATSVFGLPEVIEHGRTGYLCAERDTAALAAALDRVLSADPAELQRVGRAASERVRVRHEPRRRAAELAEILRELAGSPRRASVRAAAVAR